MTESENKLEGFEDFDKILGDSEAEGGGGGETDFGSDLDDLLGGEAGDEQQAAGGGEEAGESELDSFFEDLSTIDDLEVLQEDEEPAEAAAREPEEEPEADEEEPVAAPVAAPARAKPRREKQPREKKARGFFGRMIGWLILLGILGGGGYFIYQFFFPDLQPPWQVVQQEEAKMVAAIEETLRKPPAEPEPPPPPVAQRPAPKPKPAGPPPERGSWSIQVATCFFPSCLESYRSYLQGHQRSVLVREKTSQSESLEIYSISTWRERDEAQERADQINRANPLEGHGYIFREDGGYRVSMGAFADLARANVVKDALNQQYRGEMAFATRVKAFPYKLQSVLTGRFPSRRDAEAALAKLKDADPRLKDAFVARNQ